MSGQLQLRRGSTAENDAFTGVEGELTYDTVKKELRIHDGVTQGGNKIPTLVAVQRPTAENNYTWYRKWSDGWVEQGGQTSGGGEAVTVTLPIVMADANYGGFVSYLVAVNSPEWTSYTNGFTSRTTTTIGYYSKNGKARYWQISGMAAE